MVTPERAREAGWSADADPPEDAVDLRFDARALVALRSTVAAHADHLGLDPHRLHDLVLIAHELATNAVRHGGGQGRLRLWRSGKLVFCQVSDAGAGFGATVGHGYELPEPSSPGGRGLWIIRRLSDHMRVRSGSDGTRVTAVLSVPSQPPDDGAVLTS